MSVASLRTAWASARWRFLSLEWFEKTFSSKVPVNIQFTIVKAWFAVLAK